MTITLDQVVAIRDERVSEGFCRTLCGLVGERDRSVDLWRDEHLYDLESTVALAFADRITTHCKMEYIWDNGEGRDAIDVVCLDGHPVAVVHEEGFNHYNYDVAVLDLAALDEIVEAIQSFRRRSIRDLPQVSADTALPDKFKVASVEPEDDAGDLAAPGM